MRGLDVQNAGVIIVVGIPGAGKQAQSERLARRLDGVRISSGELLRQSDDPELQAIMAAGGLVPSAAFQRILEDAIRQIPLNMPVILEGVAKKPAEAVWLMELLRELRRPLKGVLLLEISDEVSLARTSHRQADRADDDPIVQAERLSRYHEETQLSIEYFKNLGFLSVIPGEGIEDEVAAYIMTALA